MQKTNDTELAGWDVLIKPRGKFAVLDLKSVWQYRDLAWMFFRRDFITFFKQTILGPAWYLIQPTITALTYYVVFGRIANISTDGLPPFLFYVSNIIIWSYFSTCLSNNSEVFSKNANLFGKVYFPRLVVPIASAMTGFVAFFIQFTLLLVVAIGFWLAGHLDHLNFAVIGVLPLIVVYVAALGIGVGLIVSALTVRYRDLAYAIGFVTQLWMYATPVVYPFSQAPEKYKWFFYLNPMTTPIETVRMVMFGKGGVGSDVWITNMAVTALLVFAGLSLFSRSESTAMDTV